MPKFDRFNLNRLITCGSLYAGLFLIRCQTDATALSCIEIHLHELFCACTFEGNSQGCTWTLTSSLAWQNSMPLFVNKSLSAHFMILVSWSDSETSLAPGCISSNAAERFWIAWWIRSIYIVKSLTVIIWSVCKVMFTHRC